MATLKEESKTALAKPRARACTYTHTHTHTMFSLKPLYSLHKHIKNTILMGLTYVTLTSATVIIFSAQSPGTAAPSRGYMRSNWNYF